MGKHYCRKGGAPIGVMGVPPYADPGSVVRNDDRLSWEPPTYGRVRMLFRCCATALVEFMTHPDDESCPDTYTNAVALDKLSRVPHGITYSVPCIGAEWSATLDCGHINGEGCDCDTITAEATQGDEPKPVALTFFGKYEHTLCASDADDVIRLYETDPFYLERFTVRRVWDTVAYVVAIFERDPRPHLGGTPIMSFAMPLI